MAQLLNCPFSHISLNCNWQQFKNSVHKAILLMLVAAVPLMLTEVVFSSTFAERTRPGAGRSHRPVSAEEEQDTERQERPVGGAGGAHTRGGNPGTAALRRLLCNAGAVALAVQ